MKLTFYCKDCKEINSIRLPVSDRIDMKMQYGNAIEKPCKHCKRTKQYSPKDFVAKPTILPVILTMILLIISLIFLKDWILHFFNENREWMDKFPSTYLEIILLLLLPIIVFGFFKYEQDKKVGLFNKSRN